MEGDDLTFAAEMAFKSSVTSSSSCMLVDPLSVCKRESKL